MMESTHSFLKKKRTIVCNGKIISLQEPLVMGIINITSDSFYSGSHFNQEQQILDRVQEIVDEGGAIVDIGACSTRPGSAAVTEEEEISRLSMALTAIRKRFPEVILSVDTYRSKVAKHVVEQFNVDMINDISAGEMDKEMIGTVATLSVPYIAMHIQGTPETMQINPTYDNVTKDIVAYFAKKVNQLFSAGLKDVIIDPGFGFGKTIEQNFELLQNMDAFKSLKLPILVGLSRKATIYRTLNTTTHEALNGTTVLNTIALLKGADILRVHDVKAAVEAIILTQKVINQPKGYS